MEEGKAEGKRLDDNNSPEDDDDVGVEPYDDEADEEEQ